MGLLYKYTKKIILIDAHERQNIFKYWHNIFLKQLEKCLKRFVRFNKDRTWNLLSNIFPRDKLIVLITHNRFKLNSDNGKHLQRIKIVNRD